MDVLLILVTIFCTAIWLAIFWLIYRWWNHRAALPVEDDEDDEDEIDSEWYELQNEIDRLEYQLELLEELSAILDEKTTGENSEKELRARLTNERQISSTLNKINRLKAKQASLK